MQLVISFESIGSRILQNLCMQSVVRQVQTTEILTSGRNFTPHPGDSVEAKTQLFQLGQECADGRIEMRQQVARQVQTLQPVDAVP